MEKKVVAGKRFTTSEVNLSGGSVYISKESYLPLCPQQRLRILSRISLALTELTDPAVRAQLFILRVSLLSDKHPCSRANFCFSCKRFAEFCKEMYEKVARSQKLEYALTRPQWSFTISPCSRCACYAKTTGDESGPSTWHNFRDKISPL